MSYDPEDFIPHTGAKRCTATSKRTKERCRAPAMNDRTVCYHHGGKSKRGIASPSWKHGKYSRFIPPPLLPAFERAMNDPDLLALNQDIATVESLIDETMHLITIGDPVKLLAAVSNIWKKLWKATRREDRRAVDDAREKLDDILEQGASQFAAIARLLDLTEQKRKLVETESRRREKMEEFLRIEEVAVAYRELALAVKKHVTDPKVLAAIADEWEARVRLGHLAGTQALED